MSSTSVLPERKSEGAAGFDLHADLKQGAVNAPASFELKKSCRYRFMTGLAMAFPEDYVCRIWPRSGFALFQGVHVLGGVVDSDWRGDVSVILINLGEKSVTIYHGDRIAQAVFFPIERPSIVEVSELPESHRGEKGFGSTGR